MKVLKSRIVIFLCVPLIMAMGIGPYPFEKTFQGKVTKVFDGDTIRVNGQLVRLANIDAPEKNQFSFDGHPIGKWSTGFLSSLVLGKTVIVKYKARGKYGRIIGRVFLGESINLKMIRQGMAIAYGRDVTHRERAIEFTAKLQRVGIFGTYGFDNPWYFRKKERSNVSVR